MNTSKPRYRWWGFVVRMVIDYRGLKHDYEEIHQQKVTANLSSMPSGSGAGRRVESTALRQLHPDDQAAYDAVTRAINATLLRPDGKDRIELIRRMYWSGGRRYLRDSAMELFISNITARRWHGEFIRKVAVCYGFSLKDDTPEP